MADGGWIKLYRKLIDDPVWVLSTPEQKTILITLLLMANHRENKWEWQGQKFNVQPGQMITSTESIRQKSGKGISIKNVRTSLKRFENLGFLANESAKTGRLITIANWGKYQCSDEEVAKQPADDRQRGGKGVAPNKNDKNDKKEIPSSNTLESRFDELWKLYPKKQGKQSALKAYKKAVKDGTTDDQIKSGIQSYIQYLKKEQTDPQYIKQGSSFFNQHSWEDDWSGGGIIPEPQEPKPVDKAAAALREIQDEMAKYPDSPREEAAELAAKTITDNGHPTTAAKILAFLDKATKEGIKK
ncbi:hypothetical protein [Schleiferilactobacillus harbinensis]|uniref:Uncharacterized protein n=1 Tax=Schleiferilactobacillus harbinensis TaxID=304207 RepID=A0ABU7T355_9LACO